MSKTPAHIPTSSINNYIKLFVSTEKIFGHEFASYILGGKTVHIKKKNTSDIEM